VLSITIGFLLIDQCHKWLINVATHASHWKKKVIPHNPKIRSGLTLAALGLFHHLQHSSSSSLTALPFNIHFVYENSKSLSSRLILAATFTFSFRILATASQCTKTKVVLDYRSLSTSLDAAFDHS
jgi:hypothetical protein